MQNFQDTFETRKRSFYQCFFISINVPLKSNLKGESPNLVVICNGCYKEYIRKTGGQLSVFADNKETFKIFPFFKKKQNIKILKQCCRDHFIKSSKLELNRRL